MAKRRTAARARNNTDLMVPALLPLFIITVCVVFSFLFTVMMMPIGYMTSDVRFLFIMLLVVSSTVASTVAVIFHVFFSRR